MSLSLLPSHPHPTLLALVSSQPVGEPGKQSDNSAGSGSLSPAHDVTICEHTGRVWFVVPSGDGVSGGP